jgi:hypothetical protein
MSEEEDDFDQFFGEDEVAASSNNDSCNENTEQLSQDEGNTSDEDASTAVPSIALKNIKTPTDRGFIVRDLW